MNRLSASHFGFQLTETTSGQHKFLMVCSLAIALTFGPAVEAGPPKSERDKVSEADDAASDDQTDARSVVVAASRFQLPTLAAVSTVTSEIGNGKVPESFRSAENTMALPMPESASERMRYLNGGTWQWTACAWTAPDTYSHPRYFEDVMLERHGHERWGYSQSLFSGARFFATAPMLPYLMAIQHPCRCESTLGYHRSGSCTPAFYQRPPYDNKAIAVQSATMATGLWIFP